ncbi:hypothetical protein HDF24_11450 [Mucilaginibacter sp. X4EP1]|uniref:hypothetical protein n=1 Tax=Mucilaginibacter sp. X4EP1 TaxID=2723092 RepID=UPI00216890DE|nr:hypothetical protein [Mucilaginibacter sp. X4EP1]MCS3816623.1 hypothetical protein [Mucilaginibacter sp. X4EP1]
MKHIALTISNIDRLNLIQKRLAQLRSISNEDKVFLSSFLAQIPEVHLFLKDKVPLDYSLTVTAWDQQDEILQQWVTLFGNLPGWEYCPFSAIVGSEDIELLKRSIVIIAFFAPSYTHNTNQAKEGYEVHLKDDGTAIFLLPTLEDVEKYPELYNFKGTWKEAYLLLIETLKKGWPMEEFPEELKPFLKK